MSHTGRSRLWHARAAALLLALISAVLFILLISYGRSASATTPQVDPWAWGNDSQGQLGDGGTTPNVNANPNPVQVSNLTDVLAVAGGGLHSLAIKSDGTDDSTSNDGTVWTWGNDFNGQLGDGGTNANKNTPVQVSGLTDMVAVAGGSNHSLAVKSDGSVYTWGGNNRGQLGYDPDPATTTFEDSSTPGQVSGLTDVVAVAGGASYSLALKSDGTMWAWGNNDVGQLGNGESGSGLTSITPVQVEDPSDASGFFTGVVAVAAGSHHSLAVKSDGTVWAWGWNLYGQLGDGTTTNSSTPVQASNLTGATDVSGGNFHSVALKSDGTVWAWGRNDKGQLGHDPNPATSGFQNSSTPSQVSGLTDVKDVASGLNHNLVATNTSGAVWAWGCNDYGQLGNSGVPTNPASNCATFSRTPVQTIGLFAATEVIGGGSHSLALADNDTADPTTTAEPSPQPNANGWNSSDVTVSLNATDDTGGSGVKEITYSATGAQPIASTTLPGNTAPVNITVEGETTITYFAKDNAGNTEVDQTLTVKLDRTAPGVDDWGPTGKGVPRGTNITATFSDKMDPATLTGQTLKLVNTATGKRVKNVVVSYDNATKTVTLDPFGTSTTLLAKNTKYRVTITTGAMNLAGLALDQNPTKAGNQPKTWTFITGRSA